MCSITNTFLHDPSSTITYAAGLLLLLHFDYKILYTSICFCFVYIPLWHLSATQKKSWKNCWNWLDVASNLVRQNAFYLKLPHPNIALFLCLFISLQNLSSSILVTSTLLTLCAIPAMDQAPSRSASHSKSCRFCFCLPASLCLQLMHDDKGVSRNYSRVEVGRSSSPTPLPR